MAKTSLKVALTGGVASGKSQVSALLEGYGCLIKIGRASCSERV